MRFLVCVLLLSLVFIMPESLLAELENNDVNSKIQALENQISGLQSQLDELKQMVTSQSKDKEALEAKVKVLESKPRDFFSRGMQSGSFKLRDAMGLDDESKLNIAGELNFRYRENFNAENQVVAKDEGFQLYEIELFLDAAPNDYTSIFVEYPISHKNALNPGNTWIDFHWPGELAGSENTGLMIGNFSPRFGYLNYDDNQSWIYGGRTTTNTTLIRGQSIDSQTIRNRQMGISIPIKLGSFLVEPSVFNGSGPVEFSGGADNDRRKDVFGRIQYTLPNDLGLVGAGFGYLPKTKGATANTAGIRHAGSGATHVRDIERYAVYFKYPNVSQVTLPDLSLGGKPFMVYGEYIWGSHHPNFTVSGMDFTQDYAGGYLEGNFNIIRDKLVGVFRYDYFDPDTDVSKDLLMGITPALKWNIWNNVWMTGEYEHYFGESGAANKDDDRIVLELAVWF